MTLLLILEKWKHSSIILWGDTSFQRLIMGWVSAGRITVCAELSECAGTGGAEFIMGGLAFFL